MSSSQHIPVLICAYSRDNEFFNVLNSTLQAGCPRIYINIDGTDNIDISVSQKAMIEYVEKSRIQFPKAEIYLRQSRFNLGAAVSIISSLDWFFSMEPFGLIVEDDLQFDSSLFDFISWGQSEFESNSDIWIISGSNFFSDHEGLRGKVHFPSYPVTWGWATWRDKWALMRQEIASTKKSPSILAFNPVANFWKVGAFRASSGVIDAWDIPLAEAMRRLEKFSVVPPVNLVRNIGFSRLASNTKIQIYPLDLPVLSITNFLPFEDFQGKSISSDPRVNRLYEKKIYGISLRNSLSSFLSKFDSIRLRKYSNIKLIVRLEAARTAEYRFL